MKKLYSIIILLIFFAGMACSDIGNIGDPTNPVSSSKAITTFNFASPAATGIITEATHTIAVTVPYGTNVTALVPTITHTGAGISPSTADAQDFTGTVTYTATAADASTQDYAVTVTVASNSAKAMTAFNFASPSVTGIITEATHTVAIIVPYGTVVTGLVPTITHTGAGISPSSGVAQNFTGTVTYTVTAANASTQNYAVTVTAALNSAKAITAFSFASPAATGIITEATHIITVSVPSGTDLTALLPTISISAGANVNPASGLAQDFTGSVTYTVTAANASIQAYTVTVVEETEMNTQFNNKMIFDCSRLYNPGTQQFTAGNLQAAYDAELHNNHIPELTVGDPAYLAGAYISLMITTGADGDTITKASLVLKNSTDATIRTISINGVLSYLGVAGFIYISQTGDFGYFFSSAEHNYGESVTYAVTLVDITLLSQISGW